MCICFSKNIANLISKEPDGTFLTLWPLLIRLHSDQRRWMLTYINSVQLKGDPMLMVVPIPNPFNLTEQEFTLAAVDGAQIKEVENKVGNIMSN